MNLLKAIFFDLDDTLFDHSYGVFYSMEKMHQDYECLQTRSVAEIVAEHRRLLDLIHIEVLAARLTQDQARVQRMQGLFSFCGATAGEEVAVQAAARHRRRYLEAQRAVPGARELLTRLRASMKIVVVTNNLLREQQEKLQTCGLTDVVDDLITSEEFGFAKPDPEIFRIALHRAHCTAAEAVMIGDSWNVDIVGARNAGIRPIWFNRRRDPQPDGAPVEEIHSLEPTDSIAAQILRTAR